MGRLLRSAAALIVLIAGLAFHVRNAEPRQAGLRGADQVARAAHGKVLLGDTEPVLGVAQHL